jgi:hypothetical protein
MVISAMHGHFCHAWSFPSFMVISAMHGHFCHAWSFPSFMVIHVIQVMCQKAFFRPVFNKGGKAGKEREGVSNMSS